MASLVFVPSLASLSHNDMLPHIDDAEVEQERADGLAKLKRKREDMCSVVQRGAAWCAAGAVQ